MKNTYLNNILIVIVTIFIIILMRMIEDLAWWSFVVPVLTFGTIFTYRKWVAPVFILGFLAGFIVWFGGNLYYDFTGNGVMLNKIGHLLSIPRLVVMFISGVVGGIVTGLALYTGKTIVSYRNAPTNPLSK